jgi:formiminotetrahydrofolate cyclodeaminase
MADRVNPKVRSDLTCALLLARAGLLGCLENVQINLPSIKDEGIHATINAQIDTLRSQLTQFDHVPLP